MHRPTAAAAGEHRTGAGGSCTVPAEEGRHTGPEAGAGAGASRIDSEREVARRMTGPEASRTGRVGVAGSHSSVEAGESHMGPEGGRQSLEGRCMTGWPGIRLAGAHTPGVVDTHPVAVHRAVGPRPAGAHTGAAAGTRPDPAGRHTGTANFVSRIGDSLEDLIYELKMVV